MVGAKDGPVPGQVVEVVHDDSHKEVDDLVGGRGEEGKSALSAMGLLWGRELAVGQSPEAHQEGAEHEEADEVDDGEVAAAGELLTGLCVRFGVAALAGQAGQHDLLPGLPRGTPIGPGGHLWGPGEPLWLPHIVRGWTCPLYPLW